MSLNLTGMVKIKMTDNTQCWEGMEEMKLSRTDSGNE